MRPAIAAIVGAVCLLGGCASIVEGTDQEIAVKLAPDNTVCSVNRKGAEVGSVSSSSSVFVVGKSRNPLYFKCALNSYPETVSIALAKADQNVYQAVNAQTSTLLVAPVPVAAWRTIDDLVVAFAEPGGQGDSIQMPSRMCRFPFWQSRAIGADSAIWARTASSRRRG